MTRLYARGSLIERLLARIEIDDDGCWLWTGSTNPAGYGQMYVGKGLSPRQCHLVSFDHYYGSVPAGREVDHACHPGDGTCSGPCKHRRCVNPAHLGAVTHVQNVARGAAGINQRRKTTCPYGHPYSGTNNRSGRVCHTCQREAVERYWAGRTVCSKGHALDPPGRPCRICATERSRQYYWRQKAKAESDHD